MAQDDGRTAESAAPEDYDTASYDQGMGDDDSLA